MLTKRKRLLYVSGISLGAITLVVLAILGINYLKLLNAPGVPILSAVPPTAGVIFEIKEPRTLYSKVVATGFWNDLTAMPFFSKLKNQLAFADSLLLLSEDARQMAEGKPLFMSLHPSSQSVCSALFLTEVPGRNVLGGVEDVFEFWYGKNATLTRSAFKNFELLEVKQPQNIESLFFASYKSVLLCSYSRTLVEDALLQMDSGTPLTDKAEFAQVYQTVGKRVDANVYLNYTQWQKILTGLVSDAYKEHIAFFAGFGRWSGLDVNIKDDALVLNGFTNAADADGLLFNMQKQNPAKVELTKLLPHNTASFIFLGFDNFKLYFNNVTQKGESKNGQGNLKADFDSFYQTYQVNVETELADMISSEAAYALIPGLNSGDMYAYMIIRFKDKEELHQISSRLTAQTKGKLGALPDTSSYRDYSFGSFDYPEIFNLILGTNFDLDELTIHTIIDYYLVLGPSREALIQIINAVVFNRNLNNSTTYNKISGLLSGNANVYVYLNNLHAFSRLKSYVTPDIKTALEAHMQSFVRFETFALQLSASNNLFYNNVCVQYNQQQVADTSFALWETEIEHPASGMLYKVLNHNDNSREIVVKDDRNNLMLIDRNGVVLWKIQLGEEMLSDVFQIDFFNNGKLQLLFNTANFIYIIDRNGQNLTGFPLKLKHRATNGLAVFDYDNNKTYRIFLATEKNEIVNLDKNGERVNGWNIFKTQDVVFQPVQFIRLLGKDFIIVCDKNGKSYILDRKGDIRIKPDKSFEKSANSKFYQQITPDNKGKLLTSTHNGNVVSIDFNGKTEEISFSSFSTGHYFLFEDINNNSIKDYIFVDEKKISIFDFNKKLLKEHVLDGVVASHPVYFEGNVKYKLGVVTNNNKLYLLNNEMEIVQGFPVDGSVNFVLDYTETMKGFIVAANQRIVFKYLLE